MWAQPEGLIMVFLEGLVKEWTPELKRAQVEKLQEPKGTQTEQHLPRAC